MKFCTTKNFYTLPNRSIPDIRGKRMDWKESTANSAANNMVFLDESGADTNMARHYAHAHKEKRAIVCTFVNTLISTTILLSILLDGRTTYTTYQRGTSAGRSAGYLKITLLPVLSENDIVIMDNMQFVAGKHNSVRCCRGYCRAFALLTRFGSPIDRRIKGKGEIKVAGSE